MESSFEIFLSGTAPLLYPTTAYYCLLWYAEDDAIEIPLRYPFGGDDESVSTYDILENNKIPLPYKIQIVWTSICENKNYQLEALMDKNNLSKLFAMENQANGSLVFSHIIIGMFPYGKISVWVKGDKKASLFAWYEGAVIEIPMSYILPNRSEMNLSEYCSAYIERNEKVKDNLEKNGLPPRDLFDNYMKQFTFRYQVAFEKWNGEKWEKYKEDEDAPEFDYIEEALYDGTHDKLHDGGLMKYHEAGKPKKLKVQFHVGGETKDGKKLPVQEYSAYFWFEDERIREVFDKFYGAHPDTKTDFIIKIDAEKNKYQVALYRYGLKEPVVLADDAYQLIVFRNKFECFRSENYAQPRGAWIW